MSINISQKNSAKPSFKMNTFRWAFLVSFILHVVVFIKVPAFREATYRNIRNVLEVTYSKVLDKKDFQKSRMSSNKTIPYTQRITRDIPLPSLGSKVTIPQALNKKEISEKVPMALSDSDKKINVVGIKSNIPKSQAYESYSEKIRQEIRQKAYNNFAQYQEGKVYVSFIVFKDGSLSDILVHDTKSTPNNYLKQTVVKSIKDAAPFDAFPRELDYPRISYSVMVSFELE